MQTKVGVQYWCTIQTHNVFEAITSSMKEKGSQTWLQPMKSRKQIRNLPPFPQVSHPPLLTAPKTRPWVPNPVPSQATAGAHAVPQSEFPKRSCQQSQQTTLQSSNTAAEVSACVLLPCKCAKEDTVNVSYVVSLQAKDLLETDYLHFLVDIHTHTHIYIYQHICMYNIQNTWQTMFFWLGYMLA